VVKPWSGIVRPLSALLALVMAGPALAHDTWLQGPRLPIASGSNVIFELTSGGAFPSSEQAIDPGRIEREGIRVAGITRPFAGRSRGRKALRLVASLAVEGIAVAFVSLKPRALELKPAEVGEYLTEIGERERLFDEWERGKQRWRELYRKHAKTFLRVGQAGGDPARWREPVGLGLEIVPEQDPTLIRPGESLTVVVLASGRPMPGFALASSDGRERRLQRTDAAGRATVWLDRPGRWLLAGTYLRKAEGPDAAWESDFTTLTLQIAGR
jgi:hypothetical protein